MKRQNYTARLVRDPRQLLDLTQEKSAVKLGVTTSTINRCENGKGKKDNPDVRFTVFGQDYNSQAFAIYSSAMMIKGRTTLISAAVTGKVDVRQEVV